MRVWSGWLGISIAVAAVHWAVRCGMVEGSQVVVWVSIGLAVLVASSIRLGPQRTTMLSLLAFGMVQAAIPNAAPLVVNHRGMWSNVVELEVAGASWPASTCEFVGQSGVQLRGSTAPEACPLSRGDRVRFRAVDIRVSAGAMLPGESDPADAALREGSSGHARIDRLWRASPARQDWDRYGYGYGALARFRGLLWQLARTGDDAAFVVASAFGHRAALDPVRRDQLRNAGLGHLIAVSGLHVALACFGIYQFALRICSLLRWSPLAATVGTWMSAGVYVVVTGSSAPAIRASIMLGLAILGGAVGRPSKGIVVLSVAAALMLVCAPSWILDPGFHLSLTAMVAIVTAPQGSGALGQTWRITWFIAPVSLLHFGSSAVYGLVANLIAIPVFTVWVLPAALPGCVLASWFGPSMVYPARAGARIILDLAEAIDHLPPVPESWVMAVSAAFLTAWCVPALVRRLRSIMPPAVVVLAVLAAEFHQKRPSIVVADWYAVGTKRSGMSITIDRDRDSTAWACVTDPMLSARRLSALLRQLPIAGVHTVRSSRDEHRAPHLRALEDRLRRAGLWRAEGLPCRKPPPAVSRDLLRMCARLHGSPAMVAVRRRQPSFLCFHRGRWRSLEIPKGVTIEAFE